jgi:hypothetical protein
VNKSPNPSANSSKEIGFFDKMVISALMSFFPRFGDLEALRLILDGLVVIDGHQNTRFPEFLRPHLLKIQWEIERSIASECSFLVGRVKEDMLRILQPFTDQEAEKVLGEIRALASFIR